MKPLFYTVGLVLVLMTGPVMAQDELFTDESDEQGDTSSSDDDEFLSGEEKAEIEAPVVEKGTGIMEEPGKPYFSVGLRYRWIMIPEWLIGVFGVDTARPPGSGSSLPLISNVGIGPEFTYRKDGLDITAAIWYAGLGWDEPISFKESGNDQNSWEVVTNDLHAILITFDFMWSTDINNWFAITYGAGIGLGIPWGEIVRTEGRAVAIDENGNPLGPGYEGTQPCDGESDPDAWCQPGEEYQEVWDKLKVVPWINFMGGVRFKPHRHLAIYVDGGFGIGFQVGLRGAYIF